MADRPALDRVQRWFQAVVVHPGTVDEAIASADAAKELPSSQAAGVILPSPTLTAAERLGIYHGMYPLRMEDALSSDYPALKHFLGDKNFRRLTMEYVVAHPSRSYTLNRLGDHLPEFIASHPSLPRRDFCHDLARLELAITEVFDGEEAEALSGEQIEAMAETAWAEARLIPVPAFRLLALRYPVNDYLQSVKDDDHDHPKARRKPRWLAIYRRNYAVYRLDLTRQAHDLLADLVTGRPLGEAIEAALKRPGRGKPSADELFRWFRDWVSGGIFRAIELSRA